MELDAENGTVQEQVQVEFSLALVLFELESESAIACRNRGVLPHLKVDPPARHPRKVGPHPETADVAVQVEQPLVGHPLFVAPSDDRVGQVFAAPQGKKVPFEIQVLLNLRVSNSCQHIG